MKACTCEGTFFSGVYSSTRNLLPELLPVAIYLLGVILAKLETAIWKLYTLFGYKLHIFNARLALVHHICVA
jgi:hypothetical protein